MARSRTFKLKLSPAGLDVLIESHFLLVKTTRRLLAWGTTLQVALGYLDTLPASTVSEQLTLLAGAGLSGTEVCFLGAPETMNDVAAAIVRKIEHLHPGAPSPALAQIYILALRQLATADGDAVREAYRRVDSRCPA